MTQTLDWTAVMAGVPRERFIPDRVWRHDRERGGNDLVPLDRDTDPEQWAAMVAADAPIYTQVDNGHPAGDGTGFEVTSSCSDRGVERSMLELLAPAAGDRVLEIGTGTGWNAALLAEAGAIVTTIEIDPALAATARDTLQRWGYPAVTVITADGAEGAHPGPRFDRVIATVDTREIPWAWVDQTRIGGRIVAPLNCGWYPLGGVATSETRSSRGATAAAGLRAPTQADHAPLGRLPAGRPLEPLGASKATTESSGVAHASDISYLCRIGADYYHGRCGVR